jgi:hypothetical protein
MSSNELSQCAKELLEKVEKVEASIRARLAELGPIQERIFKACLKVAPSWSGSHFGYHWNLYYGEFQTPPLEDSFSVEWGGLNGLSEEWRPRSPEEVLEHIRQLAGGNPPALETEAKGFTDSMKDLQSEILVELAPLNDLSGFTQEKDLLAQLEKWDWKEDAKDKYCSSAMRTLPNGTRDSEAFHQGCQLPTHMYYEASAQAVKSRFESIQGFWKTARRLLKQLQAIDKRLASPVARENGADYRTKYHNLLKVVHIALGLLLALVTYGGLHYVGKVNGWLWMNELSMGNKVLVFLAFGSLWVGLLVRQFRKWCWGVALLAIVIPVLQAIR